MDGTPVEHIFSIKNVSLAIIQADEIYQYNNRYVEINL